MTRQLIGAKRRQPEVRDGGASTGGVEVGEVTRRHGTPGRVEHERQGGHVGIQCPRPTALLATSARWRGGWRCPYWIGAPSWHSDDVERVLGIGGYFLRSADPVALAAWYRSCLGLDADDNGLWRQEAGPTVFATFEAETEYFGSRAQHTMLNFRVRDLEAMLAQLRAQGADVAPETQDMDGVGRFGWVTDPEGNRIELWQRS